jgi:hypothetical protein
VILLLVLFLFCLSSYRKVLFLRLPLPFLKHSSRASIRTLGGPVGPVLAGVRLR